LDPTYQGPPQALDEAMKVAKENIGRCMPMQHEYGWLHEAHKLQYVCSDLMDFKPKLDREILPGINDLSVLPDDLRQFEISRYSKAGLAELTPGASASDKPNRY